MENESLSIDPRISCSWSLDISVTNFLSFGDKNDPNHWDSDEMITHTVSEENFLYLKKPENDEACVICIKINDPLIQITNISVVSEAHIFEIYGKYEEYIKTCDCDHLTNENGINFYVGQTGLLTTHEISIKFPERRNNFWLCGIKLLTHINLSPQSTFDYHLIDEKLHSSKVPISEKAKKFKKFLQEYHADGFPSNGDPQMLMKLIEEDCASHLKPAGSRGSSMSKYLLSILPFLSRNQKVDETSNENMQSEKAESELTTPSELKTYVDESIQKLEDKLEKNIKSQLEELEMKQNEKLDRILQLLQNNALK